MFTRLSIKKKLIFVNIAIMIVFTLILTYFMNNTLDLLTTEKEIQIKFITETHFNIVMKYVKLEQAGKMTRKQAQDTAEAIIENARYDEINYVFIDDIDQRQIVNPTRPENKGQLQPTPQETMDRLIKMMKEKEQGGYFKFFTKKQGLEGIFPKIAYVKPIPEWQWFIGTGTYLIDVESQKREYILELLSITIITTILMFLGGSYVANIISSPLSKLSNQLLNSAKNMEQRSNHLTQMSENVGKSSREQANSIQETSAAIAEVTSMISRTSTLTEQSGQLSHTIAEGTVKGGESVQRMVRSVVAIQDASQRLSSIEEIIKQIEKKTMVINEIVSKTELLSLNASIEAARAGEYGKGFSVVAEEVGNLANTSGKSSNEIRELLEKSRESVQDILQTTVQRVSEGQERTTEVSKTFDKITEDVNLITTQMTQIAEATKEQEIGVKQIAIAMSKIDSSAIKNLDSAEQSTKASNEVREIGIQLIEIAHDTEKIIFGEKKVKKNAKA